MTKARGAAFITFNRSTYAHALYGKRKGRQSEREKGEEIRLTTTWIRIWFITFKCINIDEAWDRLHWGQQVMKR